MNPNDPKTPEPGFTVGRVLSLVLWSIHLILWSVSIILYPDGPSAGWCWLWIAAALIWICRTCQEIKRGYSWSIVDVCKLLLRTLLNAFGKN